MLIANTSYTVVGVLPARFRLPVAPTLQLGIGNQADVDLVLNATIGPQTRTPGAVLGRLKPGALFEAGEAELRGIRTAANLARPEDDDTSEMSLRIVALHEHIVAGSRRARWRRSGPPSVRTPVACVNIIALLLARSVTRHQETVVRLALGASRGRMVRQMLAENALLALPVELAGSCSATPHSRDCPDGHR